MFWLLSLFFAVPTASALDTQFNGFISVQDQYYFEKIADPTRQNDVIAELQLELDLKYNKLSRMHFKPLLRSNVATTEKPEQAFLNVQEAYWEIKPNPFRVRLGENTYNWGVMDGYSTQDVVNGRVLYDPLSSDRRGAPTVDFQYGGDTVQVQALYIPAQSRTLLPSSDSRWLPRDVIINTASADQSAEIRLPDTFHYYFPGYDELNHALANNYGVRVSGHLDTMDVAAIYFEGMSTIPQFRLLANGTVVSVNPQIIQATSDIGIIPVYYRQRAMGISGVWAPSDIIMKFESTYIDSLTDDPLISPWSWQNGLGFEKPWNVGSTTITSILQFYYGKNEAPAQNLVSSSGRLFDRAAIIGLRWGLTDATNMLASFLYDYDHGGNYAHLGFDSKFTDNFKGEIAGDVINGDRGTFLGTYANNARVSVRLSYLW